MTRILPGVYASIYDLSTIPEGAKSLSAGFVLKAERGPIGELGQVVSPTDFLTKYTFNGYPSVKDDTTFWTILRTLAQTNNVYVSRVAKNPLYGGLVVRKDIELGTVVKAWSTLSEAIRTYYIKFENDDAVTLNEGDVIRVFEEGNSKNLNGRYVVKSASSSGGKTTVQIDGKLDITGGSYERITGTDPITAYIPKAPVALSSIDLGVVSTSSANSISLSAEGLDDDYLSYGNLQFTGNLVKYFAEGDRVRLRASATDTGKLFTVLAVVAIKNGGETTTATAIVVKETVTASESGTVYRESLANPEGFGFKAGDLFLVYGADQGDYNSKLSVVIKSCAETPEELTESDVLSIEVRNANTNMTLENAWTVSREEGKKSLDGSALYMEEVINDNSIYIKVKNNEEEAETILPSNTLMKEYSEADSAWRFVEDPARLSGGYDGDAVETSDYVKALQLFSDKTIPVSLIGNGSVACENAQFQQALISLVDTRTDCMAFLNSRKSDETASLSSLRAQKIVKYKKGTLGSTSYYATMYAPHVKVSDVFNSRTVTIGADGVAIPGWLQVIRNSGYPYAFAGPSDGLVSGVTCDWKIGDMSGEAEALNDASINYIAFDAKVGRYYMQCQNTLQIANSAMRNVGTVLNILDIKETFVTYFKEFLQKPITSELRKQIIDQGRNYMDQVMDAGRVTAYALVDATTDSDLSDNTLRFTLTIAPTPYAEKIFMTINVTNQSYDFSIIQGGEA